MSRYDLTDIVGLYLLPPNRTLALSVDEKSRIQAFDREQPVLPIMPGRRTHTRGPRRDFLRWIIRSTGIGRAER